MKGEKKGEWLHQWSDYINVVLYEVLIVIPVTF